MLVKKKKAMLPIDGQAWTTDEFIYASRCHVMQRKFDNGDQSRVSSNWDDSMEQSILIQVNCNF